MPSQKVILTQLLHPALHYLVYLAEEVSSKYRETSSVLAYGGRIQLR